MEENEKISDSFKKELDSIKSNIILDSAYRKKKLILWTIRTMITIGLYIILWKYDWIKWTLFFIIPLSFFSLFSIFVIPYFLNKKIEKTKRKTEEIDQIIEERNNESFE